MSINLRSRVDGEFELGLLAVIDGQTLHQEGSESGSGASSEGMEDQESLKTGALLGQLTDSVKNKVDDLLADGVVAASVVVGGVLLAGDQLLGVEQLAVGAHADLVNDGRLEVNEDGPKVKIKEHLKS